MITSDDHCLTYELKNKDMKKTLVSTVICMCALLAGCSDDNSMFNTPAPIRAYERDAQIMSQFVEVDISSGTYVLNPDKKIYATDYVINRSREELMEVSEINKNRFFEEMADVNNQLSVMNRSGIVSGKIYSTLTSNTVIDSKDDDSFFISKLSEDSYRGSNMASLSLEGGKTKKVAFDSSSDIVVNVNASSLSTFYLAQVTIGDISNEDKEIILISGIKSFIQDHSYRVSCSTKLDNHKIINGMTLIGNGNLTVSVSR